MNSQTVPLGSACHIIGGGTPPKANRAYYDGDIPWATVRDMRTDVISETECKISAQAVRDSATNILPSGTVVIATRVGLGKVSIVGQPTAINQDLRGIVPKRAGEIDSRFLFWWLKSVAHLIVAAGTGATVQGVKVPFITSLPFPALAIAEQRRIVAVLDAGFAGIDAAAANAEQNLVRLSAIFDRRQSELFEALPNARHLTLAQVAKEFGRGRSKHRPRNDPGLYGGEFPFIQTGDVRNADHVVTEFGQTYNERGLAQSKLWPAGTLCITIAANIAETAILGFDACFPDSVIGMVVDEEEATPDYVLYCLQHFKRVLLAKGKGSAQDNINLATFESTPFPFPCLDDQRRIANDLGSLATTIRELEGMYAAKLTLLAELKQSLLARAFSGELTREPLAA